MFISQKDCWTRIIYKCLQTLNHIMTKCPKCNHNLELHHETNNFLLCDAFVSLDRLYKCMIYNIASGTLITLFSIGNIFLVTLSVWCHLACQFSSNSTKLIYYLHLCKNVWELAVTVASFVSIASILISKGIEGFASGLGTSGGKETRYLISAIN